MLLMGDRGTSTGLSSRQAAALLGVSVATVTQWAEHGDVPSWLAADGERRFSQTHLEEFVASLQTRPPACRGGDNCN